MFLYFLELNSHFLLWFFIAKQREEILTRRRELQGLSNKLVLKVVKNWIGVSSFSYEGSNIKTKQSD